MGTYFDLLFKYHVTMSEKKKQSFFEQFSNKMTQFTGSSYAFIAAVSIVVIWAASGPLFKFSETWQLVINTGTTIITFLMVFLIQKTQNKDSKAIHLKLNELLASNSKASNRIVDVEDLSEEEIDRLREYYLKISDLAERDDDIHKSHSIDAAENLHKFKSSKRNMSGSSNNQMQKKRDTNARKPRPKPKPPVVDKNAE
ncbi:MAG: low affinity iron permease family protein [Daejeonella sp.]|nr:low affinity iron permease family protein [Daejeonella sp.]